jgi:DNA-binding NtrC family response regulator
VAPQQPQIIGTSSRLLEALELADRVAPESISVFIHGETGTGKELFARRIHEKSQRASGPLVAVNCAAITRDLFESEMFGHERGSFTGAHQARAGYFEQAQGGTLFLDEVGDMAFEHQTKVLRALQEGEIRRVGATKERQVDVRVIAASHRNLREAAKRGTFRHDLLFRLIGFELELPPLRERGGDTLAIADSILARHHPGKSFTSGARARLLRYDWPFNIRELESVVRTAAIKARGQRISEEDLPPGLVPEKTAVAAGVPEAVEDRVDPAPVPPAPAPAAAGKEGSAPPKGDTRLEAVLAFIKAHGQITAAKVRELLHLQRSQGLRVLQSWEAQGKIVQQGRGRGAHYLLPGTGAGASVGLRCDDGEGGEGEGQRGRELEMAGVEAQATAPLRLQVAVKIAAEAGRVTSAGYAKAAKVSQRTAKRDLAELVRLGVLRAEGEGKRRVYTVGNSASR